MANNTWKNCSPHMECEYEHITCRWKELVDYSQRRRIKAGDFLSKVDYGNLTHLDHTADVPVHRVSWMDILYTQLSKHIRKDSFLQQEGIGFPTLVTHTYGT